MENERKDLIEYKKQSIISKIFSFFKGIFLKKKFNESDISKIEDTNEITNDYKTDEIVSQNVVKDFIIPQEISSKNVVKAEEFSKNQEDEQCEKDRFFKIYNDFKENRLKIDEVDTYDILRIQKMLEEEKNMILKR